MPSPFSAAHYPISGSDSAYFGEFLSRGPHAAADRSRAIRQGKGNVRDHFEPRYFSDGPTEFEIVRGVQPQTSHADGLPTEGYELISAGQRGSDEIRKKQVYDRRSEPAITDPFHPSIASENVDFTSN
jgi:hypothetical protein